MVVEAYSGRSSLINEIVDPSLLVCIINLHHANEKKLNLLDIISPILRQECKGVYSFPLLQPLFCARLLQDAQQFSEYSTTHCPEIQGRPIYLSMAKLDWIAELIFTLVIQPLAHVLYPEQCQGGLDWIHGFIVGYSPTPDGKTFTTRTALDAHTDDSEVTLTVNLGQQFEGGKVTFWGLRGNPEPVGYNVSPQVPPSNINFDFN